MTEEQKAFDIDHFIRKTYTVMVPAVPKVGGFTTFQQTLKVNTVPLPDVQKVRLLLLA